MATFNEDVVINGTLVADAMIIPLNSIGDAQFDASRPLTAEKQIHQHMQTYAQAYGSAVVDAVSPIHHAIAAGSVFAVYATLVLPCVGNSKVEINIKKNGSTILSTDFELNSTQAAYERVDAGINSVDKTYIAGDFFEVDVNATVGSGTLGQGLLVTVVFREEAGA